MATSPDDTVLVKTAGGICRLTLNRPKSLNAINPEMAHELQKAAAEIRSDQSIRVVVIQGAGDHFMAGGDIKSFKTLLDGNPDEARIRDYFDELLSTVHGFITDFREMPKPVIAGVRGAVAGAGVSLMLAADMVLAAEDTIFALAYCHLGTAPDAGSTYALPRTVGLKRAFEMALLGDRFDGETALPKASTAASTILPTALRSVTSAMWARASPPASAISPATVSAAWVS